MDVHTKQQRSYNMSRIHSKNTKPELLLFTELKKGGYKFKKHYRIAGKPDAVLTEYKIAVFVDGEYWHGKNFNQWNKGLSQFWFDKITANKKRDRRNKTQLTKEGWSIVRFWGREIVKKPEKIKKKIETIIKQQK